MKQVLTRIRRERVRRGGFTLTELLVVIGIIAVLMSIALVGLGRAMGTARKASTTAQLQAIGQGLESFKNDLEEYPPLVTQLGDYGADGPSAVTTPAVLAAEPGLDRGQRKDALLDAEREARFNSEWSLAAYLLGTGDLNGDGDTDEDTLVLNDGERGFGIRNPGKLLAWKELDDGSLVHRPPVSGRVYGPYLEPGSTERFIERVSVSYDSALNRIVEDDTSDQFLYRFVGSYGNPIRYYRSWTKVDLDDSDRASSVDFAPVELRSHEGLERQYERDLTSGDIGIDMAVVRAPYMLLAAGEEAGTYTFEENDEMVTPAPFGDVVPFGDRKGAYRFQYDGGVGSFGAALNPFDELGTQSEQEEFLRMIRSNVRYAP